MRPRKFTLIELLMVITVIIILVSLMFPLIRRLNEKGRRVVCLSNQKQLLQAIHIYAGANRGFLPDDAGVFYTSFDLTESGWGAYAKVPAGMGLLISAGYLPGGKAFHCPSLDTRRAAISGHCMNLTQSNFWNGVGASSFANPAFSSYRKIVGYHYRWPSYKAATGIALRNSADGKLVISSDILDARFSTALYGHKDGYNRVLLDGSGSYYSDPSRLLYSRAVASPDTTFDGSGGDVPLNEAIFTLMAQ